MGLTKIMILESNLKDNVEMYRERDKEIASGRHGFWRDRGTESSIGVRMSCIQKMNKRWEEEDEERD